MQICNTASMRAHASCLPPIGLPACGQLVVHLSVSPSVSQFVCQLRGERCGSVWRKPVLYCLPSPVRFLVCVRARFSVCVCVCVCVFVSACDVCVRCLCLRVRLAHALRGRRGEGGGEDRERWLTAYCCASLPVDMPTWILSVHCSVVAGDEPEERACGWLTSAGLRRHC